MEDEEGYEPSPLPVEKDEVVAKSSFSMRSEENKQRRKAEEPGSGAVEPPPEYADEGEHFCESGADAHVCRMHLIAQILTLVAFWTQHMGNIAMCASCLRFLCRGVHRRVL